MAAEDQELARIARLRRLIWLWPLTFAPAVVIAAWLTAHTVAVIVAVAIVWTIGLAISVSRAAAVSCPRCGNRFYGNRIIPNARACASCGLPLRQRHVVYPTLE
jgi:ribosomal protein L37E